MRGPALFASMALLAGCGECPRAECDGNTLITCSNDDGTQREQTIDCGAKVCIEHAGGAVCALDAMPHASCAAIEGDAARCEGAELIACSRGYRTRHEDCAASGRTCHATSADIACVDPAPHAACTMTDQPSRYIACAGASEVACLAEFAISVTPCGPAMTCAPIFGCH